MKWSAALAALMVLGFPSTAAGQTASSAIFQNIQIRCGICHTDRIIPVGGQGGINFAETRAERAGDEALCYSCHNGVVKDSRGRLWEGFQHPSAVKPREPQTIRKGGFPLDSQGRLFCGTCHTPHTKGEGIRIFMRFRTGGGGFCQRCHPARGAGAGFGEHPLEQVKAKIPSKMLAAGSLVGRAQRMICSTCHRIHKARSPFLLVLNPWGRDGLCQGCHGANPSREGRGFGNASHPVNVKSAKAGTTEWSKEAVVLSPGRNVDCWSCHRSHHADGGGALLVRDLHRGNGCSQCHDEESSFTPSRGNHPVTVSGGVDGKDDQKAAACLVCHRAHNSFTLGDGLLSYDQTRSEQCRMCHPENSDPGRNHPLEVTGDWEMTDRLESSGALLGQGRSVICATCHRAHGALPGTAALVAEERVLCLYCHRRESYLNKEESPPGTHPILVPVAEEAAGKIISAGGRLGQKREIICSTCHLVHGKEGDGKLLALDKGSIQCTLCHPGYERMITGKHNLAVSLPGSVNRFGEDALTSGLCRACHSEHGWAREVPGGGEDFVSRFCLSCHSQGGEAAHLLPLDVSHPRGVKPSRRTAVTSGLPLFLKSGRRFISGVISCATCHDVHSGESGGRRALRQPVAGEKSICSRCHPDQATVLGTRHDLSTTAPEAANLQGKNVTEAGVCSPCHTAHGGFERTMWTRMIDGRGPIGPQFCRSCHFPGFEAGEKTIGRFSHPPGGSEEGPVAASPASAAPGDGLVCTGCHDPHRWNPGDSDDRGGDVTGGDSTTSFLKWPDDEDSYLCRQCHPDKWPIAGTVHDLRGTGSLEPGCPTPETGSSLCGRCHLIHRGQAPLGWPGILPGEGEPVARMCGSCHLEGGCAEDKQQGLYFHPFRITPTGYQEGALPLFDGEGHSMKGGMMTCATCHDVHVKDPFRSAEESRGSPGLQNPFLRLRADGSSPLCAECHREEALVAGTDHDLRITDPESRNNQGEVPGDSGVCGVCHGVHNLSYDFYLWNRSMGQGTDIMTRLCTGCHQGSGPAGKPGRYYVHFKGQGMEELSSARMVFTLKRGSWVETDPNLPLHTGEGKITSHGYITCTTCHDVHRWDPDSTSPGEGAALEGSMDNSFLRRKGTFAILNSFCVDCHTGDAVKRYQEFHSPGEGGPAKP